MFWNVLSGIVRTTVAINRSLTAVGAAVIITVGVYDFLKHRQRRRDDFPPRLR